MGAMSMECISCGKYFEVSNFEREHLSKVSPFIASRVFPLPLPLPKQCPQCREQQRMAWRNERHLFARTCNITGKRLLSAYTPQAPMPIYLASEWWSERHEPERYNQQVDFNRSLFEQLQELRSRVPRQHNQNTADENQINSVYTNCCGDMKDCYLVFAATLDERCMYSQYINESYLSLDCFFALQATNCYECIDIVNCNTLFYSRDCKECSDSLFLYDCRNCANCICCSGLRQKQYHIFNQPYSKEEYLQKLKQMGLEAGQRISPAVLEYLEQQYEELIGRTAKRYLHGERNEGSSGDYLWNTKDCHCCFDTANARDCMYCSWFVDGADCLDVYAWGSAELCYQAVSAGENMYHCAFTATSWGCKYCYYIDHCINCKHCFACVGLKNQQFCILNRQYSEEEYNTLLPKVIALMTEHGEWGEFFPQQHSPYGYNHSVAADYYPLSREEALNKGLRWDDYLNPSIQAEEFIEAWELSQIKDEAQLRTLPIKCRATGRFFKLNEQELDFYRNNALPLPEFHPEVRHLKRLSKRNPRKLQQRPCSHCLRTLLSTYPDSNKSPVLCDECYLRVIA